ncbi:MAG: hypothetical protein R3182_02090, partial [Draconibacterium sp.]|nr:hypothetical protein [Draconibacterium sp.]
MKHITYHFRYLLLLILFLSVLPSYGANLYNIVVIQTGKDISRVEQNIAWLLASRLEEIPGVDAVITNDINASA